jgi:hypothetical protein
MPTSMTLVATSTSISPAAKRAITSPFWADGIWPWSTSTRKSRSSPAASRFPSASAAFASSAVDSLTSGQTTYAWRPSARRSRTNP